MALNKANISWSGKQIAKMAGNGTFTFDNIIQRSYVWEQSRKSNLIHSMIEGYPIPPFYAKKVDGRIYDFLDGKQRIDAIRGFIEGEYYLIGTPSDVTYNDADGNEKTLTLDGLYFNDLPEELQDAVKDYHLVIYYYEDITPEQVRMLFAKLNNGKPLSTKERNIANCADIITVSDIGNHKLFKNILTEKALNARKQIPIVMKVWTMLNNKICDVSFMSSDFNAVMQDTVMTEEQKNEVIAVLDKFYAIYNGLEEYDDAKVAKVTRKKMTSETHFVSLVPFIKMAIDEGISDKLMGEFMVELFGRGILVSDVYADACKGGSAKNANIKIRDEEIMYAWEGFFSEEKLIIDAKSQDADDEDSTGQNEEESVMDTNEGDSEITAEQIKENLVEEVSNVSDMENTTNDDSEIDFGMNEPEEQ